MAKRFIDTNYFNDPFILSLKEPDKLLYTYLLTICNHAGIFEFNEVLGNFHLSSGNFKKRLEKFILTYPGKIIQVTKDKYIIMSFCRRQYPNGVNSKVAQVKGALTILQKYNIEVINYETFTLRVKNPY